MRNSTRKSDLLKKLDDAAPQVRAGAAVELAKLNDAAEPLVRAAMKRPAPLESQRRLEKVLQQIDAWWAKQWRAVRAVEALERIGTPEACQVLRQLERQTGSPRLSQEARKAKQRLGRANLGPR